MTAHIEEVNYRESGNAAKNNSSCNNNDRSKTPSEEQIQSEDESAFPKMGGGKPYPPIVGSPADYMVLFDGPDDPTDPQNFSSKKKGILIFVILSTCFTSTFGSSTLSEAVVEILEEYHVGLEVSTLCTSLFVLGYASGPVM